jgi:hypothetical protein
MSDDNHIRLQLYADANYAGDVGDRRSSHGVVTLLCGNVVGWLSKKQPNVATSSCESEYYALAAACQEASWCQAWLHDVLSSTDVRITTELLGDNQGAIALARSDGFHERTKHISVRYHFIKDIVRRNEIQLKWVRTNEQLADILTKVLGKNELRAFANELMDTTGSE